MLFWDLSGSDSVSRKFLSESLIFARESKKVCLFFSVNSFEIGYYENKASMRCTLVNKIHRAQMGLALVKMCCPNAEWLVMI